MIRKSFFLKKSLGQNFLRSTHYVELIADTADIKPGEYVLEVGPGEGALTTSLLARGAKVVAVEKDSRLIPVLNEKFAKEIKTKQLVLVEEDILHFGISKCFKNKKYKVVANIPYYITGILLRKVFEEKILPMQVVLLVQKEVAERVARDKKESILSLSVKVYGEPKYVKTVPRGAFAPAPTVDSAILLIRNVSRKLTSAQELRFFELVKAGFAQKRKLLKRNLEKVLGKNHSNILQNVGISENARAEDVPLEKWVKIAQEA